MVHVNSYLLKCASIPAEWKIRQSGRCPITWGVIEEEQQAESILVEWEEEEVPYCRQRRWLIQSRFRLHGYGPTNITPKLSSFCRTPDSSAQSAPCIYFQRRRFDRSVPTTLVAETSFGSSEAVSSSTATQTDLLQLWFSDSQPRRKSEYFGLIITYLLLDLLFRLRPAWLF